MITYSLLIIHSSLVKAKLVAKTSNYWSSTENSATNAWNFNFNNGRANNNNKWNSNYVRPVLAFRKIAINRRYASVLSPCVPVKSWSNVL
ncbi:MAG: DUF1566 domain-containing protein [Bacteroidaceae bacterium]|nr:DUF1566 domain-containing protein [Bacteroidaceae bacterium]